MYVCFLPLVLFGLLMEGNGVEFRSLKGLRHKFVKLKHHVEVYRWCLSENITPKGLQLKNSEGHLGLRDFMVQVIDCTNVNNPTERESFWIEKLNCYVPHGLNLREES